MFWEKAYTPSPNIEALLQKENVKVEELLDDDDILQECKTQKRSLVQYLTRPDIIKRLIELTITEPPENLPTAERFKYANVACEVLTVGLPSLDEKLVEDPDILQTLYSFLEQEPPLNPLLSSFFSKTFNMLISRKSEQDWFLYQKMCLQVLEFLKSRGNFLDLIFKHFATPVIMDLLLQMIKEVQGGQLKKNLYEWLTEQQLVERLINMLGQSNESDKHDNIAEFLSDVIRNGRSMRQKEQDNDSFEPVILGIDPLLQCIEDEKTISLLLDVILNHNQQLKKQGKVVARDSSIIAGINIVLTLVDESIVDEPASDQALQMIIDKEKENHDKVVSTVIRVIAPRLKEFHDLLLEDPDNLIYYFRTPSPSPPFGQTRLQICRLFSVLLRTGNNDIIQKICETDLFVTLLKLFKHYHWNNFLHTEVEKCFEYIFATSSSSSSSASTTTITLNKNDQNDNDFGSNNPFALQSFVIANCKIVSMLIDCWMHNKDIQSSNKGHRLGYMGHLIKIFQYITTCISNSDHNIGALIESNLIVNKNRNELENWKLITNKEDGEFTKELELQNKMLANCDAHETNDYNSALPKEFNNDNLCANIDVDLEMDYDNDEKFNNRNLINRRRFPLPLSLTAKEHEELCEKMFGNFNINDLPDLLLSGIENNDLDIIESGNGNGNNGNGNGNGNHNDNNDVEQNNQNLTSSSSSSQSADKLVDYMVLNLQRDLRVWGGGLYNNEDDDDNGPLNITVNPWGTDPFLSADNNSSTNNDDGNNEPMGGWADFTNNFADFDSHFNTFSSDLGAEYNDNSTNPMSVITSTSTTTMNPSTSASSTTTIATPSQIVNNSNNENIDSGTMFDEDDFNKKFNSFEKSEFDNNEFELNFHNAKNLNMFETNTGNTETGDIDEPKNNDDDKKKNDDDANEKNKECQNSTNNDYEYENNFEEASNFSQTNNDHGDTQLVNNSGTNLNEIQTTVINNKDNNNSDNKKLEKNDDENEIEKQHQEQELPLISTSNGPIHNENDGVHDCSIEDNQNQEKISIVEGQQQQQQDESIKINKEKENENEQQSSSNTKLSSPLSLTDEKISKNENSDCGDGDDNVVIINNDDDLPKNMPTINIDTTTTATTISNPTTSTITTTNIDDKISTDDVSINNSNNTFAASNNIIPLEKQENGPV